MFWLFQFPNGSINKFIFIKKHIILHIFNYEIYLINITSRLINWLINLLHSCKLYVFDCVCITERIQMREPIWTSFDSSIFFHYLNGS